jgi:hypothetical protein
MAIAGYAAATRLSNQNVGEGRILQITQQTPRSGRQVLVILIGSGECRFSSDQRVGKAYWTIVKHEENRATAAVSVTAVGIAVDNSPVDGLETLRQVGAFDEYLVGNGWLGTGAVRYVVRDMAGMAVVPQVLILSRPFERSPQLTVGVDSLHLRLVGVDAILRWATRVEAP